MPEICRFFGIVIYIYFGDHAPPHFHVRYGRQKAIVSIETLQVLRGSLSPRVSGMVTEWGVAHRAELREAWRQASAFEPVDPIAPLE